MTPSARLSAAIDILSDILAGDPAEKTLTNWARRNRYAGSSDRAAIRDTVFDCLRSRRSCAYLGGGETGRGLVLGHLRATGLDIGALFNGQGYAPAAPDGHELSLPENLSGACEAVQLDYPDWMSVLLRVSLGGDLAPVMTALKSRAKTCLRVNIRKCDITTAIAALEGDGIKAKPVAGVSFALEVTENPRKIALSSAYLTGLVEVQDAASQAVVESLVLPGNGRVLDYCAGGGGKVLAMAARANGTWFAHDADPHRMADLPARATRAGVDIACLSTDRLESSGPFDLVFCDVPCSGSGAWRRAPASKWDLTENRLRELCGIQGQILASAARLVAPGGQLVYATCSILACENRDQIDQFQSDHPEVHLDFTKSFSPSDGADGMFVAVLRCD